MAAPARIVGLGDDDLHQQLVVGEGHLAHALVPRPNGDDPPAVGALDVHLGVQGHEGGGGVGGGNAVADVAADGARRPELGPAGSVGGLAQHGDGFPDHVAVGDPPEGGEGPDADVAAVVQVYPGQLLLELVDGHQAAARQLALPALDEHVGAAGDDHRRRIGPEGGDGVVCALGLIDGCDVVHDYSPFASMSPAAVKASTSRWGFMGRRFRATPVA